MPLSKRGSRGWRISLAALATFLLIATALPGRAAAIAYEPEPAFCETSTLRDFLAPLERLPKLHQPSESGRIGFGPSNLRLRTVPQLVVGGGRIGFTLGLEQRQPLSLRWTATTTLVEVDHRGRPVADPRQSVTRVGALKAFNGDRFQFKVPEDPAFYRVTIAFHNAGGKKLGAFGLYYRIVRPINRAKLTTNAPSYRPGSTVFARVENYGNLPVTYGVGYTIEKLEGATWMEAPESPRGATILILLHSLPGQSGRCNAFGIPPTMAPGTYRISKEVGHVQLGRVDGEPRMMPPRRDTTLTDEFSVVP